MQNPDQKGWEKRQPRASRDGKILIQSCTPPLASPISALLEFRSHKQKPHSTPPHRVTEQLQLAREWGVSCCSPTSSPPSPRAAMEPLGVVGLLPSTPTPARRIPRELLGGPFRRSKLPGPFFSPFRGLQSHAHNVRHHHHRLLKKNGATS